MTDVFAPEKRSAVMSRIRSKGNRDTELQIIKLFKYYQFRGWRRNRRIFGKPDFVFPHQRVAVFVDGCFWHGCPKPRHAPLPKSSAKSSAEWWATKLLRNKTRDRVVTRTLRAGGTVGHWFLRSLCFCAFVLKVPELTSKSRPLFGKDSKKKDSTSGCGSGFDSMRMKTIQSSRHALSLAGTRDNIGR